MYSFYSAENKTISIAYYDQSGNNSASDIMDVEHLCTSLHLPSLHLNNFCQNCKWYIHGIQIQLSDRSSNSVSAFIFYLLYHSSYLLIVVHAYVVFLKPTFCRVESGVKAVSSWLNNWNSPCRHQPRKQRQAN